MLEWIYRAACRPLCLRISLLLLISYNQADGQLIITSPTRNLVMQRNASGTATIGVTAYAHYPYARITATLTAIEGNTRPAQEVMFSADQTMQGFLHATFTASTGWYRLKLTGTSNDGVLDSAIVDRVGIGEVFLVTGNSNAMGLPGLGSKNAGPNVVSFNAINKILNNDNITVAPDGPMPVPEFEVLTNENFIFPNGETSWYWGELGDMLFKRWKTPVLFFNAAWAAANADNYRDAASGKDAFNLYVGRFWPNRQPYSNIVNTLRFMTASTGIRAILWAHGENDAQLGFKEEDYFNGIKTLIQNSRRDAGYQVAWYMARNSASNAKPDPYQPVLQAQNRLVAIPGFNVFQGPYLDTIQIPRPTSGHFENVAGGIQGLTLAATAWNRSLADSAIGKTVPLQPAYTLHAGVTPSRMYAGASFILPYHITGKAPDTLRIGAEVIDEQGNFAGMADIIHSPPLTVRLPSALANGTYRLRLNGLNPVLPGSLTEPFHIDRSHRTIEYVGHISARTIGPNLRIAWVTAPAPGLQQMILQKTTDGMNYSDLQSFAPPVSGQSGVFGFTDSNAEANTAFYRIRMVYSNSETAYSAIVTVFRNGAPPAWTVFPNPVTQQQFYLMPSESKDIQCRLFDVAGKEHPVLASEQEAVGLISVRPFYPLPAGKYILQISSADQTATRSVIFN
nr:T9SS type A sorting domain-containing protein [uncultured Dyadobacter sp.]